MEEEGSLCVRAVRVVKVSIARAIIQHMQPVFPMPCEDSECRPRLLAHQRALGDDLIEGKKPLTWQQPNRVVVGRTVVPAVERSEVVRQTKPAPCLKL